MNDLFYSKEEKILFYIAGYTDNSSHINDIVSMLTNNRDYLARISKMPPNEIRTTFITKSSRYKYNRVFYVTTENIPEHAFIIGDNNKGDGYDWTMMKWLEN